MEKYGRNEVTEKRQNSLVGFLKRFWGLTAWMLEIAIALSFVLGKFLDLYIITTLLLVNALLGFVQEQQATRAVKALKQKLRLQARVLRDKVWATINAAELVPGDIIRIRSGDSVPADLKIIDTETTVDQSAITGESLPIEKKPGEVIYSGSIIRKGEATGVIVATGASTYFGKTTELVQLAKPKLHMEEVITGLMKWLLILVVSLLLVASVLSLLRGLNFLDILPLALILLLFLVEFVTISLSTDNVRSSEKPETWNITPLLKASTVLGVLTVAESLGLLYIGLTYLGLSNKRYFTLLPLTCCYSEDYSQYS
jgi:H+-transporting ATPase